MVRKSWLFVCGVSALFTPFFSLTAQAAFNDNGDGTVTDAVTGLMWEKCSYGKNDDATCTGTATTHTWSQALRAVVIANGANYKSRTDWRLPNKNELESLVKIDASNPAIDTTAFPNTASDKYWSSTNFGTNLAWRVSFNGGEIDVGNKTDAYYVRLVRGGDSFASFDAQFGIAYSATTFTEAAVNDGSISSSVTLTLSGDTYVADVVSANRITAVNVPAGLTANFVRDSDTVITATLTGNATAHTNADDVSNLTFTFADGAFVHTASAADVPNYTRNNLVVDFGDPAVTYSATTYTEAAANDGSTATSITLTLSNDTYVADVVSANRISAGNVPAGLTANFVRDSDTVITATLTGNATAHANADDISNLTFTFADGAFTNTATAANVANYARNNLVVDFADPTPAIAYSATTYTEAAANDGSTATSITLTLSNDTYVADVVSANRITAGNVPTGLAANFVRDSDTVITAMLTGNATTHAHANDISNLTFTFANGAFTNTATAANVINYAKNNLVVDFTDPASAPAPSYTVPTTLPTGGGTTTLTGGQSVTVTENGQNGTTINLPPPSQNSHDAVKLNLPGSGDVSIQSTVTNTQLGVTHVTLPGATTSVTTVTVDSGSATLTASKEGQAMAGLKNGIVVVSGSSTSQVSVDSTGSHARIGIKGNDTLVVPSGSSNVSGTSVDLPPPTSNGAAPTVKLNIGGQNLTIQSSLPDTSMTFQVMNIGGVQTPVLAVTGSAQVTSSGEDKPLVSVGGNVIRTGKSGGGGGQVCNTVVQASSDAASDAVHVVTCYVVLDAGSFSSIAGKGHNGFAAIKDGVIWAGETAEFDKNGKVTAAYLGTKEGTSGAVGDDMAPGGNKFTAGGGYKLNAFIPRLAGVALRLDGAKLDESLFAVVGKALGVAVQPVLPIQSDQGVLNFNFTGNVAGQGVQNQNVTYTISSDTASMLPSRRIRVDTSRADGLSISAEGGVDVATGGLVTTFVPSVSDPKAFADSLAQALPGSTNTLRWNGTWQVIAVDGMTYVGRPQWSFRAASPDTATFSATVDGNLLFSDSGRSQLLFPDFYDYDTLQATFRTELKDPTLVVLPRMDGTAVATVNGESYTLAPQWNLVKPAAGKPVWWTDNGVLYIRNTDGSAQGFTVK